MKYGEMPEENKARYEGYLYLLVRCREDQEYAKTTEELLDAIEGQEIWLAGMKEELERTWNDES